VTLPVHEKQLKNPRKVPCIVVLDTMWGSRGRAPVFFRINPNNHSGKRLYKLIGHEDFWVTNCCREQTTHARLHGTPDPSWLKQNLLRITPEVILLCGRVAQETWNRLGLDIATVKRESTVYRLPHPAARNWTKESLQLWTERLAKHVPI